MLALLEPPEIRRAHELVADELLSCTTCSARSASHARPSSQPLARASRPRRTHSDWQSICTASHTSTALLRRPACARRARWRSSDRAAASTRPESGDAWVGKKRIDALLQQAKALLATDHIAEGRQALELARRERHDRILLPEPSAGN